MNLKPAAFGLAVLSGTPFVHAQCDVVDQYVRESAIPLQTDQARSEFLVNWQRRLFDFVSHAEQSTCRTKAAKALLAIQLSNSEYTAARATANLLLSDAQDDAERLIGAHSVITVIHASYAGEVTDEALAECRSLAATGLTNWPSVSEVVNDPAKQHNVHMVAFLRHVIASTEPSLDQSIVSLRALTQELAAIENGERFGFPKEIENLNFEARLKLLRSGRLAEVLAELRAMPDTFEGRTGAALGLLNKCGCREESTEYAALEQFLLTESSDLATRVRIAQTISVRQYRSMTSVEKSAQEVCRTYVQTSERVRQLSRSLLSQSEAPPPLGLPHAILNEIVSDSLYTEVQVLKYHLHENENALARAIEFVSLFPADDRVAEVKNDVGLE